MDFGRRMRTFALLIPALMLAAGDPPKPEAPPKEIPKDPPAAPAAPATPPPAPKPEPPKPAPPAPGPNEMLHCEPQKDLPREKLVFFEEEFDCELCLDETSRATGMGARTDFPAGTAMVFVHPRPIVLSYWMKDCLIDLDIVFVDANGRIAAIHRAKKEPLRRKNEALAIYERRLPRYGSNRMVQFALEFPAGTLDRWQPSLGTRLPLDWKALAARAK